MARETSGAAETGRTALPFSRNRKAREAEAAADAEYLRLFHNYEGMGLGWFWATVRPAQSPMTSCTGAASAANDRGTTSAVR